jgi:hypothetical protein
MWSNEQKKLECNDILNLLHWSNPKQKYSTQKNYIKSKIIKMGKMEIVDGPLAHDKIHSKI